MRSLKAIPFLYQAKVKFPPLTFDLNISVAQPTVILFVYCLWPVSDTIISDAMTWSWYSRCFALSTFWSFFDFSEIWWPSTWCCFIIKHQWLDKLNGELTKLWDIPFLMPSCLRCLPWRIQSFTLRISVRFKRLWSTSVLSSLVFCIERSS